MGTSPAIRQHRSNEFGHAFCRWFLYEHLNITYFAHMQRLLNRQLGSAFGKCRIERTAKGDTPDYFCAENVDKIFLSEAKGRHSPISFGSSDFNTWRNQFTRVVVKDRSGVPRSMKGYIVATRFATEAKPSAKSRIFAEDPESPGEGPLGPEESNELGRLTVSAHYAVIAEKLNQSILAAALEGGYAVPDEIQFPVVIWVLQIGPLAGTKFVGGYYPSPDGTLPIRYEDGRIEFRTQDPLRLDLSRGTFFGLEESIFRQVTASVRGTAAIGAGISQFDQTQPFYSGVSILRDGSAIGPVEFFAPVATVTIR
jgi:hypothetical protein